ncbi:MAG: 16S rRNA (adenine(1518)-N(6)/adenine(1519)-N(6))-dimethyltransferase RsmA [Anaerolineae bacterium]
MSKHNSRRRPSYADFGQDNRERIHAKKGLGQHFLTDPNILQKIVGAAEVQPGDIVLEIGPGLGHLTRALLAAGARVVAVELDLDLAAQLRVEQTGNSNLAVVEGDFLVAAPQEWLRRGGIETSTYKVVANLPYYITSAILRHLLEAELQPAVIVVMVQREVAQQMTAQPPDMSLLAVSVQFYGRPRSMGVVPAGAFTPRPQVDSAIVRIAVTPPSRFPDIPPRRFFEIVRAGFGMRRKQVHNALQRGLGRNEFEVGTRLARAGIDPRRRAETLSLDEWRRVYDQFQ